MLSPEPLGVHYELECRDVPSEEASSANSWDVKYSVEDNGEVSERRGRLLRTAVTGDCDHSQCASVGSTDAAKSRLGRVGLAAVGLTDALSEMVFLQ